MLESIRALKNTLEKKRKALFEEINLHDFITTQDYSIVRDPFPYLVVDNFFKPEVYSDMASFFRKILERGLTEVIDSSRFSPFLELQEQGFEYDGYKYVPKPGEDESLAIFYSLAWNLFFSDIFKQPTGWSTSLAFHHHPPGNRTGFVHNDYVVKYFSRRNRLANGVIHREQGRMDTDGTVYSDFRTIALLFYIGNDEQQGGDSGGTGLYLGKAMPPFEIVAPVSNRLLAFQISPKSFHAFQSNKQPRNSIVQWFHTRPEWCLEENGHL